MRGREGWGGVEGEGLRGREGGREGGMGREGWGGVEGEGGREGGFPPHPSAILSSNSWCAAAQNTG